MSIDTGIINLFLRPPIGLQKLELIPGGPFTLGGNFTRPRLVVPIGNVGVDAFGIRWLFATIAPGYGLTPSNVTDTIDRIGLRFTVVHRLLDQAEVVTQLVSTNELQGHVLFQESFPLRIEWQLAPGISANFWWLVRPLASP